MESSSLPVTHRGRSGSRAAFWICAGVGVFAMLVVWCWVGFAAYEEYSEQSKALAAGTSMEGFAAFVGGIPLAVAHGVGLMLLLPLGWRSWRIKGIFIALAAVVIASLAGMGLAQILFAGQLFGYGETFIS